PRSGIGNWVRGAKGWPQVAVFLIEDGQDGRNREVYKMEEEDYFRVVGRRPTCVEQVPRANQLAVLRFIWVSQDGVAKGLESIPDEHPADERINGLPGRNHSRRSEERRVGKEFRTGWARYYVSQVE